MDNLEKLFAEYEKCFGQLDFQGMSALFSDAFIASGPSGIISGTKKEYLDKAKKAASFYKKIGMKGARILSRYELSISDEYCMVTIHWGVVFQKMIDKKVEFDASYIVHKVSDPRIIMMITHQDEAEMMEKLQLETSDSND